MMQNVTNFTEMWPNATTPDPDPASQLNDHSDKHYIIGMLSVFSVVGTIGNSLILYVFSKMLKQKLTSTVFILTLAATDFITCLVTLPATIVYEYYVFDIPYDIPCKLYMFMMTTTVPYSSFIMVAIGIDRYLCICHPFLHAMNIHRAKMLVLGMAVLPFTFGILIALYHGTYTYIDVTETVNSSQGMLNDWEPVYVFNISNLTVPIFLFSEINGTFMDTDVVEVVNVTRTVVTQQACDRSNAILSNQSLFQSIKYIHSSFFVIAIVVVAVLYSLILRKVLSRTKGQKGLINWTCFKCTCLRKKTSGAQNDMKFSPMNGECSDQPGQNGKEATKPLRRKGSKKASDKNFIANMKVAGTLFVVAFVFVIAFTPAYLMTLHIITPILKVYYIYFIYNIANPVIYAFMNQSFRNQLMDLCGRRKVKQRGGNSKHTQVTNAC